MSAEQKRSEKIQPSRLRRAFKRAALGGLGAIALVGAFEATGYRALDSKSGTNIITKIDPSCRTLTDAEKELAHEIFGDQLNTDHIKVFNRRWFGLSERYTTMAPNNNIYTGTGDTVEDFTKEPLYKRGEFIHELTHTLQRQKGQSVVLKALKLWLASEEKNYGDCYYYDINQVSDFNKLNIEQQAGVVEDFYINLEEYKEHPSFSNAYNLRPYAELLSPLFPSVRLLLEKVGYTDPVTDIYNKTAQNKAPAAPVANDHGLMNQQQAPAYRTPTPQRAPGLS